MKWTLLSALLTLSACGGATQTDGEAGGSSGSAGSGGVTPAGGAGGINGVGGSSAAGGSVVGGAGGGSAGTIGASGSSGSPTCTLELMAAGELPGAEAAESRFAGPGVVATDAGFALAYAETTAEMQSLRFVRIGELGDASVTGNAGTESCPGFEQSPGLGASFAGPLGLAISALPRCNDGNGAGALMSSFAPNAAVVTWSDPKNSMFSDLHLSAQPVAAAPLGSESHFAYIAESGGVRTAQLARVAGVSFKPGAPIEYLFFSASADFVNIASSSSLLGIVANVPSLGGLVFELRDHASNPLESGMLPSAPWAALTAWDQSVAVLAPSPSGLALTVVEAGAGATDLGVISGVPQSAAIARLDTGLALALADAGQIQVLKLASGGSSSVNASTVLDLSAFGGSRVALATGHGSLLVAWLDPTPHAQAQSSGGWALLDCAK